VFRIDSPSAVPSIPITPPPFAPGFFTDGNPASGAEATIVDAWWLNMVQEEILTVITSIGMAADKADSSQLYQAIQRIAEAANPDLAGFLPLSGGTLYRPGGGDLLTIRADQQAAPSLHARLVTTIIGVRTWAFGTESSGAFSITDITGDVVRLTLGTGGVFTYNGPANITGNLTGNNTISAVGDVSAGNNLVAANIVRVGGQGIQYPALGNAHNIGWVFDGSFLGFRVDGQFSGGFVVPGAIQSSSLVVSGNAALNTWTSGNGTVNGNLNVNFALGVTGDISSAGQVQGTTLYAANAINCNGLLGVLGQASFYGGASVSGYLDCGNFGVHGNANVVGGLTAGQLELTQFDLILNQPGAAGSISRAGQATIVLQSTGGQALWEVSVNANRFVFAGAWAERTGSSTWDNPSDARLKKDIAPYEQGLAAIRGLAPVSYAFNGLYGTTDDGRRYVGFLADDCREVMPELVVPMKLHAEDAEDTAMQGINVSPVTFALVNAVKELAERIEELEAAWPQPSPA
jgi:hypothetical protein